MAYYHILRQRRLNLNLSIEYISSQTRLAPQYIQAIEEHNLDVFSDDFSFVRYFVRAYCDAIGVNWNAISDEVDQDINAYARQRSMALSQAQRKLVRQMPSGKPQGKRHSSQSRFQKRISSISRNIQWRNRKNIRKLVIGGIVLIVFVAGINLWLEARSASQQAKMESDRQAQLLEKEQETDRLAKQRQEERENQELQFEVSDASTNVYRLSNVLETTKAFTVQINLPEESTVVLYKNDQVIDPGQEEMTYQDTYEKEIEVTEECRISIEVGNYVGGDTSFTIADKKVTFNATYWEPGTPATIYIDVVSNETASQPDSTQEQVSDTIDTTEEQAYEFTE